MADNFITNPGAGGDTFAADEIGGVKYQREKVVFGVDGAAVDVSAANPLPVTDALGATEATLLALSAKVTACNTGSVTIVSSALPSGAATEATLAALSGKLPASVGQNLMAASLPVVLASDQSAVPVSGTISVTGVATEATLAALNAKIPAQGQALMAASIPVVIASNQSAVPVSGTVTANAGSGTFAVSAVALPLPTGAATEATLSAMSAKLPAALVGGRLDVNIGASTTLTVNAHAVTQSGTWTVQPGNTQNTTPWLAAIHDGSTLATVRNLAANDALNVAIVDGSGNHVTSFGGGTQYAEDTAHVSGDSVTMAGVVQQSADSALAGDGDRTCLQVDSSGYLKVNIKAGAGSGGTAMTDDAAFTPTGTSITPVGGTYRSVRAAVGDGDAGAFAMNAKRGMYVSLETPNGDSAHDDTLDTVKVSQATAANLLCTASQGGTWNINNISGTISLPTGAATQATLAQIKTFTDDVRTSTGADDIRVNVITGTVAIGSTVTPGTGGTNLGKAEDAAHSSGETGVAILAVRRDTPIVGSDTDGDYSTFNVDASGRLYVNINDGGNTISVDDGAGSLTVDGTVGVSGTVTISGAVTNAGTFAVQETGAALTALQLMDDTVFTDDAAFTVTTSKVHAVGMLADETSPDSVDEGDAGIPRMTLDRMQIITPRPSATGEGLSIYRNVDLNESDVSVKASAGKVYGWYIHNAATAVRYVHFYDASTASVTVGTTTSTFTIPIPAGSAANVEFSLGLKFSTAITVAATTDLTGSGAPSANDVQVAIFYA